MKILFVLAVCLVLYSCGGTEKQNQPQNKVESSKEEVTNTTSKPVKSIDDGNIYYKVDSVIKGEFNTKLFIKVQFPYDELVVKKIADEMYSKSSNKKLFIYFYLNNRNQYSMPFATVDYPKGDVYYPRMYPEKIDLTKVKGEIIGAWYNDDDYDIKIFKKTGNKYSISVFTNPDTFYEVKLKLKDKSETVFEEDRSGSPIKGLLYTIKNNKELEAYSQSGDMIHGLYTPVNLDSIKLK